MSTSSSAVSPDEEAYMALPKGRVPVSLVPVLKDEIDRKADETLDWLINAVLNDKIDANQFSTGLDVLFMAVSGLTHKGFVEKITKADEICKAAFRAEEVSEAESEPATSRNDDYGVW